MVDIWFIIYPDIIPDNIHIGPEDIFLSKL